MNSGQIALEKHCELTWQIPGDKLQSTPIIQKPMTVLGTVPCTAPMAGNLPAIGAVQGDCETV